MGKVKIGIHQHVFTSKITEQNLSVLDYVKEIGFDSMDVNLRNTELVFAKTLRKRAEKLGLVLTGGGSLPKTKELVSPDKEKRTEAIKYMKELVRKAYELGIEIYHGLIYTTGGVFTGKSPTEEEFGYAVEGIKEVAEYASQYGVSLGLETANRYETYMVNTVEGLLRMLDAIDEPNTGLLLDTYHMNIEEKDLYKSIVSAKGRTIHFHVNENDRGTPGTGHIPWDDVFKGLKDIGYDKVIAIESFVDDSIDIASLTAVWRKLAPSAESLAKEGYAFIRKMSEKYLLI
ncbi:MAG: sugar phosphate isomerase/epimerase [Actinomycetota bacterium]|jgi:D-psicose/D-tagatose/L-ribulose 3-epimerase|nr:sugar phosphate isomerase/epimerase [Actinomycetota bacterium]